jgi:hypothetical protein
MQGVESFVSDELGRQATVVSDARPGFSISGSGSTLRTRLLVDDSTVPRSQRPPWTNTEPTCAG